MRQDELFLGKFTSLHNRLYGKVFSFVRLRINDPEEVKDIVQDVFLKAFNSWKEIPEENTARNYLYIIAKQRMIDIWRSARNRLQTDLSNKYDDEGTEYGDVGNFDALSADEPLPEEVFAQNESKQEVMGLLNQLKIEERELLVLRFLEELEYRELAEIYKTTENNLRQRVSRGLQNLKKVATNNKQNI